MPDTKAHLDHTATESAKNRQRIFQNPWVRASGALALVLVIGAGIVYAFKSQAQVGIDLSQIVSPTIDLSADVPGTLDQVYVNVGDQVPANTVVAKVGDDLLKTKIAGVIVSVQNDLGKTYSPGQAVVSMIDPTQLRVVGTIDENKGLSKIKVGQPVTFTVDAFGSKQYVGVVDEVGATAHETSVVFNISDQRPTQSFDIKVRFNSQDYPELKNGMSAKMTVFVH